MAWARKKDNGPWNCPLTGQLKNKKGGNIFSNFPINKKSLQQAKEKKRREIQKREQLHTHSKDRKKRKKDRHG